MTATSNNVIDIAELQGQIYPWEETFSHTHRRHWLLCFLSTSSYRAILLAAWLEVGYLCHVTQFQQQQLVLSCNFALLDPMLPKSYQLGYTGKGALYWFTHMQTRKKCYITTVQQKTCHGTFTAHSSLNFVSPMCLLCRLEVASDYHPGTEGKRLL